MRSSVLGAAAFFLSFHLLAAASAHAQGPHSEMRSKPPPSSGIAHNFFTWLHHVTGAGPHRHRIVSAPPLPRPRPAQLAKVPVEQPAAALEPKKAQPAATAVQPNNAPGAAERDRAPAPAVESNEAQPAAAAAVSQITRSGLLSETRRNLRPLPLCQMTRPRSLSQRGRNPRPLPLSEVTRPRPLSETERPPQRLN